MAEKIYVLDTNVLIYDPKSIFTFKNRLVGIPVTVLEELDQFKSERSERGNNARTVIRHLDALRGRGSLREGVPLDNGGTLRVLFAPHDVQVAPPLKDDIHDNIILLTALQLKEKGDEVHFVSKDINARVKADVLGIDAVDYLKGQVEEDKFYKGWVSIDVPAVQLKKGFPEALGQLQKERELYINEFVWLQSQHNPYNYRVFRYLGGKKFKPVAMPKLEWPLEARNAQQLMALDLLLDPEVQLISLIGPAGTGKTFLTLLAGLHQVLVTKYYKKMLISRPVIPLGPDIGYLPGDIQEKMFSWMQPVYDNMELIIHSAETRRHVQELQGYVPPERNGKKRRNGKSSRGNAKELRPIEQLINMDKISLEAITYMRGRSIPYQFVFIDEVQNLNHHEVKTLVTRVGEGSKIILAGDPFQIDSPYLDFSSNGLVLTNDKFKGQKLFGSVFLEISERSELSRLASELL